MSEETAPEAPVEEEVVVEEEETSSVSIEDCLKTVLRTALVNDGLARGLREATKALSRGEAQLCVLCDAVTEQNIIKLVEALCNAPDEKIPLIKVSDAKQLGEWARFVHLGQRG
ncbi:40s ribosomal protein s12 [Brettanomyces bruxellensis AWRI1499]|nr:40s ribosomal protein s12 [Brettanomyces bruxellensis AWRI1499]